MSVRAGKVRLPRPARGARLFVPAAALVLLIASVSSARAAPVVSGEFDVSGLGTDNALTTGPDGNVWVTLDGGAADVAQITPAGVVTEHELGADPMDVTNPIGITVGPDGNLWVTQTGGVAKFSPADPSAAEAFMLDTGGGDARGITAGPDGNLWTASDNQVVRVDPVDPEDETLFDVLGDGRDIAADGDGNLWVADAGGAQIVGVTTDGDPAPGSPYAVGGMPQGVAGGPGTQIAYANPGTDPQTVGRITPGGAPLVTPTPLADPFGVALGADGAYWIAQFATDDLGRLTPDGQYSTLDGFSAGSGPRKVAAGPGNTLWVTLDGADKIGRVSGVEGPSPPPSNVQPPPNQFTIVKVKRNKRKGIAKVVVDIPGPGELELAKNMKVKPASKQPGSAGREKLKLKPRGKAKRKLSKRRLKRRLRCDGKPKLKARVKAKVTYTPVGGTSRTKQRKLKLVRKGRRQT